MLIDYLLENSVLEDWKLIVADADLSLAQAKTQHSSRAEAVSFDIHYATERTAQIRNADIVISLLPPALHNLVAKDCLVYEKNLLTASYVDDAIRKMETEIKKKGLLFLCEMGLDPGIDHMSAMSIIDSIRRQGGKISTFRSHCGGLVAPESDDNPWHYKLSWNPKSVVLAGKAGAHYREKGEEKRIGYEELFSTERIIEVPGIGLLSWYPNRDSLRYASLYGLENAQTFVRTTLRHQDFMYGWKNLIDLKLTDETPQYETNGKSLQQLFKEHMDKNGFSEWLEQKLNERFARSKDMLENLMRLMEVEQEAEEEGENLPDSFMTADDQGNIETIEIDDVKNKAAAYLAQDMHEANLTLKQLFFLGLDDQKTLVNKGLCSAADILQFAMEKKLSLRPYDKDMIVMLHELQYELHNIRYELRSTLIVKGDNNVRTAMAKTVGLPLGIAVKNILNRQIQLTGLQIPTQKEIYIPVLRELERKDVKFNEELREIG